MQRFSAAHNAFFLTTAAVFQKVVAFVYFTIVARALGVDDVGKYVFALTFTTLFAVFADLGLGPALNREVARDQTKAQQYLHATLVLKALLIVLVYGVVVLAVNVMDYSTQVRQLVYASGITMIFDTLHYTFYAVLRGLQNVRYEAYAVVASQTITLLIGGVALVANAPLIVLILAFTVPSLLNSIYAALVLKKKYGIRIIPVAVHKAHLVMLAGLAWAFALAGIFSRLYSYVDTLLLAKLLNTQAVGIYSIPNKIAFAFQFIPLSLIAGIYPAMSRYFVEDKTKVAAVFEQAFMYLTVIALPIAGGLLSLGPDIVVGVYGMQFVESVIPLQILMFGMVCAFLAFPAGTLLNACNKQKSQTAVMGVTVLVNVVLNIILIPRMLVAGAALAALASNALLLTLDMLLARKVVNIRFRRLLQVVLLTLCATMLMIAVVLWLKQYVHWALCIPAGVAVYALAVVAMRVVTKEHWLTFKHLIRQEKTTPAL